MMFKQVKHVQEMLVQNQVNIDVYVSFSICLIILECLMPQDCKAWYELGIRTSGIWPINPGNLLTDRDFRYNFNNFMQYFVLNLLKLNNAYLKGRNSNCVKTLMLLHY